MGKQDFSFSEKCGIASTVLARSGYQPSFCVWAILKIRIHRFCNSQLKRCDCGEPVPLWPYACYLHLTLVLQRLTLFSQLHLPSCTVATVASSLQRSEEHMSLDISLNKGFLGAGMKMPYK